MDSKLYDVIKSGEGCRGTISFYWQERNNGNLRIYTHYHMAWTLISFFIDVYRLKQEPRLIVIEDNFVCFDICEENTVC